MSIDRKLAWACLLVGLVALLPVLREAPLGFSVALIILLVLVGGYLVYSEWSLTRTAITTLFLEKRVVIHDRAGVGATLTRIQKVKVNHPWLEEIWFRNMVTDGNFGPVSIDGKPPSLTTTMGCLVSYCMRFKPPLSRGAIREVKLVCDITNSFPANEEGLLHDVAQDTRVLILKVELPHDRTCLDATLLLEAAGEPAKELEKPEISSDRRTITSTVKKPITGYTYHLHWRW